MASVEYAYLKEALMEGELVTGHMQRSRDRVYIWGNESDRWAGVYRREDFVTETEARELRPELFI